MSPKDDRDPGQLESMRSAPDPEAPQSRTVRSGSIRRGVLLVLGGHAIACSLALSIGADNELDLVVWVVFLGITQLAHVLPLAIWAYAKGEHRTLQGIWIAAGITALLNAACVGITISVF